MRTLAVALTLVLTGCGGASDPGSSTPKPKPTKTKATPVPKPTVAAPKGTPAPEALSQFVCAKDGKGVWNASGAVANSGKTRATFQVTVHVGEAAGTAEQAVTKQLANIEAGGSAKFALTKVPAPKAGGTCRVQVLRR